MIPRNLPELSTTTALPPRVLSAIFCLILCIGAEGQTRVTYFLGVWSCAHDQRAGGRKEGREGGREGEKLRKKNGKKNGNKHER